MMCINTAQSHDSMVRRSSTFRSLPFFSASIHDGVEKKIERLYMQLKIKPKSQRADHYSTCMLASLLGLGREQISWAHPPPALLTSLPDTVPAEPTFSHPLRYPALGNRLAWGVPSCVSPVAERDRMTLLRRAHIVPPLIITLDSCFLASPPPLDCLPPF
jgi:hypothetical protein